MQHNTSSTETVDGLQAKSRAQLACEYGIHRNCLRKRLKAAGIILPPGLIMPADLIRIYHALGWPPTVRKT